MKSLKTYTLLFGIASTFCIGSCSEDADTDSIKTSFVEYSATLAAAPLVTNECGNVYTLNFSLDDKQNTDVTLLVSAGKSSTAAEGVDFEILTHEIAIPAYAGQDGFSVDIEVLQDFEIEEGGNESIFLTFHSATPNGISPIDVLVAHIEDSGLDVEAAETSDLSLNWQYTDDGSAGCALDLDLTLQTAGSNPYEDDLLGFEASTLACGESGTMLIEDMLEGEVYDMWVWIYAGEAVPRDLTVTIDYARMNSAFNGGFTIDGVFDSGMDGEGYVVGTIEKNCNVVTIRDTNGNVVAEGRVRNLLRSVHDVTKPF